MGRRPFSVLIWGLVYLLIGMLLPMALIGALVGGDFTSYFAHLNYRPTSPANFAQFMGPFHGKLMLIQPIVWVTSLALQAILTAAVFRAIIEPRNRGLAYLRLGPREWWLAVLNFVIRVLAFLLFMALALAGLALGFGLNMAFDSQHVEQGARVLAYVVLGVVMFAIFIGVCVRYSLASPMTFAEGRFRLFESWGLTRRHGWKLIGLAVLTTLVTIVVVMVLEALAAVIVLLIFGGLHWDAAAIWSSIQDQHKLWTSGLGEGLVALTLLCAYGFGGIFAVMMAPWAVVYRELLPRSSPPAGGLFGEEPPVVPAPAMAASPGSDHGGHDDHGHHDAHGHDAHGHDDHGHADPHAHGDDHGHGAGHGHGDDHGHADDHGHGHGDAHGHGHDDGHGHGH